MTTIIAFTPQTNSDFQFQASLDGNVYNIIVTWSFFGARYYVNIYDTAGTLIVSRPLIGTPLGYDISSAATTANTAVIKTATAHTFRVGSVVKLTITGITPDGYNGTYLCNVLSHTRLSYTPGAQLDPATQLGQVNYNLSMTEGYFVSTLVYSPDSQQFIITP